MVSSIFIDENIDIENSSKAIKILLPLSARVRLKTLMEPRTQNLISRVIPLKYCLYSGSRKGASALI